MMDSTEAICKAIPIKCFIYHRTVSSDGGSVIGQAKNEKNEHV